MAGAGPRKLIDTDPKESSTTALPQDAVCALLEWLRLGWEAKLGVGCQAAILYIFTWE